MEQFIPLSGDPGLISTMGWAPFRPGEKNRFLGFCKVLSVPGLKGGESFVFCIIESVGGKPVGYVSVKGIDRSKSRAEIGIAVMEKNYRGKGYGSQALALAVEYAFTELGLSTLELTVFPSNERAIKAYEKAGFHKKGLLRDSWRLPDGKLCDMVLMEISSPR